MQKVTIIPVEDTKKLIEVLGEIMEKQSMTIKPISGNLIEISA